MILIGRGLMKTIRSRNDAKQQKRGFQHGRTVGMSTLARNSTDIRIASRRIASAMAASAILLMAQPRAHAEEASALRLCADPTNLPFSSEDPSRPVAYNWYKSYFGKRTVRTTLLGKECDMMVGLPDTKDFMGPAVIFSAPIATESYALVYGGQRQIESVADLKGLRVAVQFQSTPQNLLALDNDISMVTTLSPDEAMQSLAGGKADVTFVWGPAAAWLNATKYQGQFKFRSTSGDGLEWRTAIGFAKGSKDLRDQVDAALPGLKPRIDAILSKYGFPSDVPIKLSADQPRLIETASMAAPATPVEEQQGPVAKTTLAAGSDADSSQSAAGRTIFNGTCAHCHGTDAVQGVRKINLRLLHARYGDDFPQMFWKTVHEGRPSKGMPVWKDVFSDEDLGKVLAFLQTIQEKE